MKEGLVPGKQIRNKATIIFDTNDPIETAEWLNTIAFYLDDFEDGDAADWTSKKGSWSVIDGALTGNSVKKADIVSPFEQGCRQCTIETDVMLITPRMSASILGWSADKKNLVELQLKEGKLKLKQKSSLGKGAKGSKSVSITLNTNHHIKMLYNGAVIEVYLDGVLVISEAASIAPAGTVGFRIKGGTASFGEIVAY